MLFVFGDSHSVIWGRRLISRESSRESKFPLVKIHHLGPALAYNLMGTDGDVGKWGKEIISLLNNTDLPCSSLMLSFGEIDIRLHVIKRAIASGKSIDETVSIIVQRYIEFIDILRSKVSVPMFVWGPLASAKDFTPYDPIFSCIGSEVERNSATKSFNNMLKVSCKKLDRVYFFSLSEKYIDLTLSTKDNLIDDCQHMGLGALEEAIAVFNSIIKDNGLNLPDYFDLSPSLRQGGAHMKNISGNARIIHMSSNYETELPKSIMRDVSNKGYVFHTNNDDNPSVLIDIGYAAAVRSLLIFNRFDGYKERTRTIEIFTGNNLSTLSMIYHHDGTVFGEDNLPLNIPLSETCEPFRYILIKLREKEYFHLGEIAILANTFL